MNKNRVSRAPLFNRKRLKIKPLAEREHGLDLSAVSLLRADDNTGLIKRFIPLAEHILKAREDSKAVILMMGAHVIRAGVQKYIIDLMKRGYISCLALNGAGMIHDFEYASVGATTESVACYIRTGEFGLWRETGRLNDIINRAYCQNRKTGMGEAVGKAICEGTFPYKNISLLAAGYELGVVVTVHVGIGYDIIHEHPNCDGAATGGTSYNDFLKFAAVVEGLEGGAIMNFGSAIMAPEVFLKALSMARNVACQGQRMINRFATLVCDLHDLPRDFRQEPSKDKPFYYFRPWKTMLVRTVAEGGRSFYIKGNHADTIPALWTALRQAEKR